MASDRILLIIINAVDPYQHDIQPILALPSGFIYRNRFDIRWIQDSLRNTITKDAPGSRCLIVVRDKSANRLVPIRYGVVRSASAAAGTYYFQYELAEYVTLDTNDRARKTQIEKFNETFSNSYAGSLVGYQQNSDMEPLVFFAKLSWEGGNGSSVGANGSQESLSEMWGNIVAAVAQIPEYKGKEFLRILEFSALTGEPCAIEGGAYLARDNTLHVLKVFQRVFNPIPGASLLHELSITGDGKVATAIRSKQLVVGKYDILTFLLDISAARPGYSVGYIDINTTIDLHGVGPLHLPVRLKRNTTADILRASATAIFVLLLFFAGPAGRLISPGPSETRFDWSDFIRSIATLALIALLNPRGSWRETLNAVIKR